jgi:hypothetical protein
MDLVLIATVVGSVAAVAAVGVGLWQGWLAVGEHRRQKRTEREAAVTGLSMLELQRRGQATERFTHAIEQLGSEKVDVRIGAVYALEQIARDSGELHWPIMEVLTAYLREHASAPVSPYGVELADIEAKPMPADHQAIATVIGRRRRGQDPEDQFLDLRQTDLSNVRWAGAHLEGAYFGEARLERAFLHETHLKRADFFGARLQGAFLVGANLEGADLSGADLNRAILNDAQLEGADLTFAHGLTREQLKMARDPDRAHLPADLAVRLTLTPSSPPLTSSESAGELSGAEDPD